MRQKHLRKALITAAKVALAAALLGYVISKVPLHDVTAPDGEVVKRGFLSVVAGADWSLVALAAGVFLVNFLLMSVRWWYLMRLLDLPVSLWRTVQLTFLGLFFNAVVPGTVGGDLVKAWYVARTTPRKMAVVVSVFFDRALGLAELTLMGSGMILLVWLTGMKTFAELRTVAALTALVLAALLLSLTFLLSRRLRRFFRLQRLYHRLPFAHHIEAVGEAVRTYRRRVAGLLVAVGITILAHIHFIGAIALAGVSVGLGVEWYYYYLYVPLIYIFGAVPLTPGGVGYVEGLYDTFFTSLGAGASEVFALALLARFLPLLWGLPGVLVTFTGPKVPEAGAIESDLGIASGDEDAT